MNNVRANKPDRIKLSVNVDHVATVRNARGGVHPNPLDAALLVCNSDADGVTVHLREDRRHIRDNDLAAIKSGISKPLMLEMAATEEMRRIALDIQPAGCSLVPEGREELTTEGGLDVVALQSTLSGYVRPIIEAGITMSLFVDPDGDQLRAACDIGVNVVELHTGCYADAQDASEASRELDRLITAARQANELGLICHAGHGLGFDNAGAVAAIPEIRELHVGHFLIAEALFMGLDAAIRRMRQIMDETRGSA